MKFLTKLIISATVLTPVTVGVVGVSAHEIHQAQIEKAAATSNYSLTKFGKTLTVNRKNLDFEVKQGDQIWRSNPVLEGHEKLTSLRQGFLHSALTVYYLNQEAGESNFSIFQKGRENMTKVRFIETDDGFEAKINIFDGKSRKNPDLNLDVVLEFKLTEKGISIKIKEIKEYESKNKLSRLVVYPGFGASYKLVDGYMLIPDGNGALIDLSKKTSARSLLNLNVYDSDIGIMDNNRKPTTSEILTLAMFGMNEENRSTLAYITSGEEFASLSSKVSGITDSYNMSYFTFNLRSTYYHYDGISESTKRPTAQKEMNICTPEIHYDLYDSKLEYYDFARLYRDYLILNDMLNKSDNLNNNMRLEFLMAENKKSMFGREVIKMTSTKFIQDKVNELTNNNLDLSVALYGYTNNGLTNSYPNCFPIENKTGSISSYRELGANLKELGIPYSFIVDFVRSFEESGVSKSDLAMNMSEKYIQANDYNPGNDTRYNHLTVKNTEKIAKSSKQYLDKYNGTGFDHLSLGNKLYSSYYNEKFSRTDAKERYKNIALDENSTVSLRKPNQYMFGTFENYLDTPSSNSGFVLENENVPFLSTLLSGYKNMYSTPINLNYTGRDQILRLIDYNIKPTFLLSEESAINLLDTTSNHIFSSKYSDWENDLTEIYNEVNSKLERVKEATFISRKEVSNDVYLNEYSNGTRILVNYSNEDFIYETKQVKSKSAEVF